MDQIERLPPRVQPWSVFTQRMTFETELLSDLDEIQKIFNRWGYRYAWDVHARFWFEFVADKYLGIVSSQSPQTPTLRQRWEAISPSIEGWRRPLACLEMALTEARRLGLTLRMRDQAYHPLTRDAMLKLIDPDRKLEEPEQIGILQIAAEISEAAKERRDCFVIIDVSPRIRQFGAGKSQLMMQVLAETNRMLGNGFDARWDVVYGEDHRRFRRLLGDTSPEHAFGVDELDQFAYSREAMKGANKETMQTLKQTRKWGRPIVACSASLWQLDPFLRDIKITHRFRIEEWDSKNRRGRATVWEKGGFADPPNDLWGRVPPVLTFEFVGLPSDSYKLYYECAILSTREREGMDKYLKDHPSWPQLPENGGQSPEIAK